MIFIQARTNSKRFPNKIMEKIGDKTLLEWVYHRAACTNLRTIFLVPTDDACIPFLKEKGYEYFEGPEHDVLSRFYFACVHYKTTHCIRLTADCPFIEPARILGVWGLWIVYKHLDNKFKSDKNIPYPEFVSNCYHGDQIDGQEVELITTSLLSKMNTLVTDPYHREHVTTWAKENGYGLNCFSERLFIPMVGKMSVDTPEDLERLRRIYARAREDTGHGKAHTQVGEGIKCDEVHGGP